MIEGKSIETRKIEEKVNSFFDVFEDKEIVGDEFNDIAGEAEFFRDELIPNSLELFLDIVDDESEGEMEEIEEGEDQEDELEPVKAVTKDKKKGKKVE